MAKKAKGRKRDEKADSPGFRMEILQPPSKAFFERLAPPAKIAAPETSRVAKGAVSGEIRDYAQNWSASVEEALNLPKSLHRFATGSSVSFCSDEKSSLGPAIDALAQGELKGKVSGYGIIVNSTASTTSIVVVDMSRRIIVRETLGCLHDRPQQREWATLSASINAAAKAAKETGPDTVIAIDNGSIRRIRRQ